MIPKLANAQVPEAAYIYKKPDGYNKDNGWKSHDPNRF
jgi:hypothetical protein